MIAPSQIEPLLRQLIRHEKGTCCECGKPPERLMIERDAFGEESTDEWRIVALCSHGKNTHSAQLGFGSHLRRDFNVVRVSDLNVPKTWDWRPLLRFFRKNWVEYRRPTIRELLEGRKPG